MSEADRPQVPVGPDTPAGGWSRKRGQLGKRPCSGSDATPNRVPGSAQSPGSRPVPLRVWRGSRVPALKALPHHQHQDAGPAAAHTLGRADHSRARHEPLGVEAAEHLGDGVVLDRPPLGSARRPCRQPAPARGGEREERREHEPHAPRDQVPSIVTPRALSTAPIGLAMVYPLEAFRRRAGRRAACWNCW